MNEDSAESFPVPIGILCTEMNSKEIKSIS